MSGASLGVVTVVHGRHEHLALQQRSLLRGPPPAVRVVVAMADPAVAAVVPGATVVEVARGETGLPLAAARNEGARAALSAGAERLVFLDVDCVVDAATLPGYAAPAASASVWCGPVTYLPHERRPYHLDRIAELDDPHPARPAPGRGTVLRQDCWELFWSLSFALDACTWERSGGFDPAYEGYGGEDTDFGQRLARQGVGLVWNGDARAYHQWHPTSSPPIQHRHDIVRNANLFHDRWGWWPMAGWLEAMAQTGAVTFVDDRWAVC